MRSGVILTLLTATLLTTACAASGPGDFCVISEPIFIRPFDMLTAETGRQVLSHNEIGAALCGW